MPSECQLPIPLWGWKGEREDEVKESNSEVLSMCSPTLDIGGKTGEKQQL